MPCPSLIILQFLVGEQGGDLVIVLWGPVTVASSHWIQDPLGIDGTIVDVTGREGIDFGVPMNGGICS